MHCVLWRERTLTYPSTSLWMCLRWRSKTKIESYFWRGIIGVGTWLISFWEADDSLAFWNVAEALFSVRFQGLPSDVIFAPLNRASNPTWPISKILYFVCFLCVVDGVVKKVEEILWWARFDRDLGTTHERSPLMKPLAISCLKRAPSSYDVTSRRLPSHL